MRVPRLREPEPMHVRRISIAARDRDALPPTPHVSEARVRRSRDQDRVHASRMRTAQGLPALAQGPAAAQGSHTWNAETTPVCRSPESERTRVLPMQTVARE